jgi:regulator of protease activity HflC (stomatin/prohibitin superfamily)
MNAERNKRAVILEAEGNRQADITHAEGKKEAQILEAEAERESSIRRAQGLREARILEAEGTSEAIKKIAEAKSQEIEMVYGAITKSKPTKELINIKALEAMERIAEGPANKVFIPFDTSSAFSALGTARELLHSDK